MTVSPPALRVTSIAKSFGRVTALRNVSFSLGKGEVLGLVGDNGAGKSTLIKILSGFHQPDAGTIELGGEPVALRSVAEARAHGIETVYQDLALVNELTVYHNMFLNREIVGRRPRLPLLRNREMRRRTAEALADIGVNIPSIDAEVAKLSGGQRQAIAVARSVYSNAKILLLDEPLAAMGAKEAALIMQLILRLKERGDVSIILIAHDYAQIFDLCDRVMLLRHGTIAYNSACADTSIAELTDLVVAEYRALVTQRISRPTVGA